MSAAVGVALVGMGKIARDQHLPAIAGNDAFRLAATVSPSSGGIDGVPHFRSVAEMLSAADDVAAVALCSPPQVRYGLAMEALRAGRHVFLEKPPGATLGEVAILEGAAREARVSLFASWHSRHAAGVEPATTWLRGRTVRGVRVTWREDVRRWHPGQEWIWEAGGLGVFDPGINALSIVTRILPERLFLKKASLSLPANRAAPIAAELALSDAAGVPVEVDLDWRQVGPQTWDIAVETDDGALLLSDGGATLEVDGRRVVGPDEEYPGLYRRFAELVAAGESDVDVTPLILVADAFLRGERRVVEPFD